MKTKNSKAFTLIELLVVITIITILATISIPQFSKYRIRAFNVAALSDLRNLSTELEAYYVDDFKYPVNLYGSNANWVTSDQITTFMDTNTGDFTFYPTKGVSVRYVAGANQQVYILSTKHASGDAFYVRSSFSSRIYQDRDDTYKGVSNADPSAGATFPTLDETNSTTYKDSAFTGAGWEAV
jgi:prepilin-type N-terminal cleavage/methylation domain-containing protein